MRMLIALGFLLTVVSCCPALEEGDIAARIFRIPNLYSNNPELVKLGNNEALVNALTKHWDEAPAEIRPQILEIMVDLAGANAPAQQWYYQVEDNRVVKSLVAALDSTVPEVRVKAAQLLETRIAKDAIEPFDAGIVTLISKHVNVNAILLLGRIGNAEAKALLRTDKRYMDFSAESVRAALAKTGDKIEETYFIKKFQTAKDAQEKRRCADLLGYIATESAAKALAKELRTSETVQDVGVYSLRVFIIDALSKAFPKEPVLWRPAKKPKDDSYYEKIEAWASEKLKVTWSKPRPPFFYLMPTPGKPPAS